MATKAASKRLGKEAQLMDKDPPPYCYARPREDNVLEWHFILRGPPDTPYHGGEYWGQLLFPADYPFKPPGIKMSTPSGRFYTDSKICTSMSDFHPGSWNPAWSVANILVGLLSFMCTDEMTTGGVMATAADRGTLAMRSHAFNITNLRFKKIFPDYSKEKQLDLPNMGEGKKPGAASTSQTSSQSRTSPSAPPLTWDSGTSRSAELSPPARATFTSANPASQPGPRQEQAQAQPVQPLQQQQPRSKALFPFLVALLAYLFFSRLASTISGTGTVAG